MKDFLKSSAVVADILVALFNIDRQFIFQVEELCDLLGISEEDMLDAVDTFIDSVYNIKSKI